MKPKHLKDLLQNIIEIEKKTDRLISGMSLDSREIKPGYLFFACLGTEKDGRKYIDNAINNGAIAIISESNENDIVLDYLSHKTQTIPILYLPDVMHKVSEIAAQFYEHPSKTMTVIAVTGTNGKTSCCHFIAEALEMCGERTAVLGTLGNGLFGAIKESTHTTPNPIALQELLYNFQQQGATHVVMEASSHGIDQGRLAAIDIHTAIFTNLSRDHLDYHGDMARYGQAKRKLFQIPGLKHAIFNMDDDFGHELFTEFHPIINSYGYSVTHNVNEYQSALIRAHQIHFNLDGLTASVSTPWGNGLLHTSLLGRFNLSNLLAVFTTLSILGYPLERIIESLAKVKGVKGRMEICTAKNSPLVVIDYAHTPDALSKVLLALREYATAPIWCVFGCGGNRDQGKRALMGRIAENHADHVIVTDDNPRHEEPAAIVADILQGMTHPEAAVIEHDRRRAIKHAITSAKPGEIVLIAGKGHELYQQVGDVKHPFNDKLEVQMILAEKES